MPTPTIYIVSDGKPGHLSQSRGLAKAIGRRVDVVTTELADGSTPTRDMENQASNALVIAAGRRTYGRALSLAGRLAAPAIALMNPGWLQRRRFDLCVIPWHDGIAESANVIVTQGALNSITPAANTLLNEALLLVGGPSDHHHWEDESLAAQLRTLLARDTALQWTATGSRRTPESTKRLLQTLADEHGGRLVYTPASQTPQGWVAEQLQRCGLCWVTEDSVSMVYEPLSAGARVGLLDVPRRPGRPGRVVRGVQSLIERGWVTRFDDWREGRPLPADRPPLAEADRVAQIVLERFPAFSQ